MRQLLITLVIGGGVVVSGCSKSEPAASSSSTASPKSATEAIQGAAPSVVKGEPATCPPGAKCDGYCAPDQAQIANGALCASCTAKECDAPLDNGCSSSPDPKACEAIVQCFHRTNCLVGGAVACYCGDATVDTCAEKGPSGGKCTDVIAAGFPKGMPPGLLIKSFGSAETAGGFATGIGLCIQNFCAKACVPYCGSKS